MATLFYIFIGVITVIYIVKFVIESNELGGDAQAWLLGVPAVALAIGIIRMFFG